MRIILTIALGFFMITLFSDEYKKELDMPCSQQAVMAYLNDLLNPTMFSDIAINGLQIEGGKEIRKIASAVTSSLSVINRAVEESVDLLLVHHGIFLHGKSENIVGVQKEKITKLLQADINLVCFHIPLDANEEIGNNWSVARALDWQDLEPFGTYEGKAIGVRGVFSLKSREEFVTDLQGIYKVKPRVAFGGKEEVSSCAILSGGAHKWIDEAIAAGVDCFVTGTGDENSWHKAFEHKINFLSFGHAATEKIGIWLLGERLKEHFAIEHFFIDEENPF